jgi:N,N-dimethylformamidase
VPAAFVSDENDMALPGVAVVAELSTGERHLLTSAADGGIDLNFTPGQWTVTLALAGFGSKRVRLSVSDGDAPYRFRLLSDRPLAYVWPKWCRGGERVVPQVHSVEPFEYSVLRYGLRKEQVPGLHDWVGDHGRRTTMQITPDGDYTTEGVQWGRVGYRTSDHHARSITTPERSGLYFLHVTTESGDFTSAPFLVAPARPTAPIAVMLSTNTWNSYNEFGGRSNYLNPTMLPERPTVNTRQEAKRYQTDVNHSDWKHPDEAYGALSFERPEPFNVVPEDAEVEDPIPGFLESSLVAVEWRTLAWLEREGFSYDVYADKQLHDGVLDLDQYRVLLISGHPEYWSREMIERLESWLESGGRLLSLGGNSLNCEIEYPTATSMRHLTFLGDGGDALGMANSDDGSRPLDSRLHRTLGRSEAEILGIATTIAGFGTGAPYAVVDSDHWAFKGTGLGKGSTFGSLSLSRRSAGGASGWETDKTTIWTEPDVRIIARGTNPDHGGAEFVVRTVGSAGGGVVSAGSITFAASLLVDSALTAVTRNLVLRCLGNESLDG